MCIPKARRCSTGDSVVDRSRSSRGPDELVAPGRASFLYARISCRPTDSPDVALAEHTGRDIFVDIFMPTTVHIPDPLLKSVDRRAKALGISRNRLVVRALEQAVSVRSAWAPEFLERLRSVDQETSAAADELLAAVKQARRSKEPHDL
jgi:predicted transcriptional regulator